MSKKKHANKPQVKTDSFTIRLVILPEDERKSFWDRHLFAIYPYFWKLLPESTNIRGTLYRLDLVNVPHRLENEYSHWRAGIANYLAQHKGIRVYHSADEIVIRSEFDEKETISICHLATLAIWNIINHNIMMG